ncbi:LacI family DNA-binding transcriptional regulator [Marinibacterium sp. SX1]|uniref:LacI family DNA-binding transcriptional regulator n=1 Tax=Marinibacterium sp. SX1 TaxID=3388424 RepID=UPI003D17EAE3
MGKPTVHDIAREAGVSLATVDRVLNARPGVRAQTVARVREAVERLGYVRDTYAANLARQKQYRFAFVLPEGPNQFLDTFRTALGEATQAQAADRLTARVLTAPAHDPHAVVRLLNDLPTGRLDGVAIMTPETPQVRDAVSRLKSAGLPIVALVSDLPNSERDHFVGINSYQAGRTAGLLMGRFIREVTGAVLVVTQSMQARDSIERRLGFDHVMGEQFNGLSILPSVETHGDPVRMARILAQAFRANPGIRGVYSMGPGNAALLDALRPTGRLGELAVVAHELTPTTRQALIDREIDAVINQNVGHLVRSALRVLRAKCDGAEIFAAQERIRIDIVLRENLP